MAEFPILNRVASISIQVFTANGTYTKPANLITAYVRLVGGGGGGGGTGAGANRSVGGPGGGGGYAEKWLPAASIGATETVTIGTGGTAGNTTPLDGGAGGTTSFGALLSATGGAGGWSTNNADTVAAAGAGGTGAGGDLNLQGDRGFIGYANTLGNLQQAPGGGTRLGAAGGGSYGNGGTGNGGPSGAGGPGNAGAIIVVEFKST